MNEGAPKLVNKQLVAERFLDRARAMVTRAGQDFLATGLWRPCPFKADAVHEYARAWEAAALDAIAPILKQGANGLVAAPQQ